MNPSNPVRARSARAALWWLLGAAIVGSSAHAAEPKAHIDPRANQLLRELSRYLVSAPEFSFHAEILYDEVLPSTQKLQFTASLDAAVRHPNHATLEYRGDLGAKRFWYDGRQITLLDPIHRVYAVVPSYPKIDTALDEAVLRLGLSVPLADLLYMNPYRALMKDVTGGAYVGIGNVTGMRCHHLAFSQPLVDWQIWIEDGRRLAPRKLTVTYKTLPGSPQYTAILSDWDFRPRLPDRAFSPQIPEGAERIEFLPAPGLAR
jgi:hypothetical protein